MPGDSQNDPNAWDDYRGDPLDPISKDWPRPQIIPDSTAGISPGRPLGGPCLSMRLESVATASARDNPYTLTDLYPTLCDLAGIPTPQQCDGESLVPQIKDPATKRKRLSLTSYAFGPNPSHAVSDARYRLIRYDDGFEELYDLQTDPNEFAHLASKPDLAEIKMRLSAGFPQTAAPRRGIPRHSKHNLQR